MTFGLLYKIKMTIKVRPPYSWNYSNNMVITKTLMNRLKEIMPSLVAPNQRSFVPNRQIIDNVIIYQEILHSMRKKLKGKRIMLIKLDLEKAYDRLS